MSLLLDALKKAEKAKDEAKRRAQGPDSAPDPDETVIHVRTRDELPDISRPMEIHSEDIPGKRSPGEPDNPVPDAFYSPPAQPVAAESPLPTQSLTAPVVEPPPKRRGPAPQADERPAEGRSTQQATAKKVFEAKFREPNPRLPFYITMGFLGLFAAGTVIYFWYQLRPPPALVNTDAKPPADEKKIEAPDTRPPANALPAPSAVQVPPIPGLPSQPPGNPLAGAGGPPNVPAPSPQPQATPGYTAAAAKAPASQPAPAQPQRAPRASGSDDRSRPNGRSQPDESKLSVSRAGPMLNPKVVAGWEAYNKGDMQSARVSYESALSDEPANRDALLGLAAVEMHANRLELAEGYYQRILDANPRDPHAQAGMLALRSQVSDPVQAESRVKNLISGSPEAHVLYFSLGNQFAQQERWPEAQQAYFKAFSAEPENPDFAYNLAVSLDHTRQPKLALEYYRRAIALAQQRASSFDQALARNRAQELAR